MFFSRVALGLLLALGIATQPALAALSIVQTATSNPGTAGTSPSVTFSTAPANGDMLLFTVQWASSTVTGTLPSGYTSIIKNQSLTGCYAQFSFYKIASSATSTITFTNLLSANAVYSITGFDISGQGSSPINASGNNGTSACGATHTVQPTATSTVANTLAITLGVDDGSGTNLSAPSGWTAVQAISTTFNTSGRVGVYDESVSAAGTVNPSWGSGTNAHAQVIVIAPYVAPPPGSGSLMMMGCCR